MKASFKKLWDYPYGTFSTIKIFFENIADFFRHPLRNIKKSKKQTIKEDFLKLPRSVRIIKIDPISMWSLVRRQFEGQEVQLMEIKKKYNDGDIAGFFNCNFSDGELKIFIMKVKIKEI